MTSKTSLKKSTSTSTTVTARLNSSDIIKFVRPDRGPFSTICMYAFGEGTYAVIGHAGFNVVIYNGDDRTEADRVFFKVVDKYQPEPEPNLDDEL